MSHRHVPLAVVGETCLMAAAMLFDASMTIHLLIKLSVRCIFFFIMTSSAAHGVVVVVIASFETITLILFHPLQSLQDTYKRCINRTKVPSKEANLVLVSI